MRLIGLEWNVMPWRDALVSVGIIESLVTLGVKQSIDNEVKSMWVCAVA
jgi:hypothetical protein